MFTGIMLVKLATAIFALLTLATTHRSIELLQTHKDMRNSGVDVFKVAKRYDVDLRTLNIKKHSCNWLHPIVVVISLLLTIFTGFVFADLIIGFSGISKTTYTTALFVALGLFLYADWLKSLLQRDIMTMQYNFNHVMLQVKLRKGRDGAREAIKRIEEHAAEREEQVEEIQKSDL